MRRSQSNQTRRPADEKVRGIAARAGRWSAIHKKTAIIGWFVFVVLAFMAGGQVGQKLTSDADFRHGESGRADKAIADHLPKPLAEEQVVVTSDRLRAGDRRFDHVVDRVVAAVDRAPHVVDVRSPRDGSAPVSADGRTALMQFAIAGDIKSAADRIDPVNRRIDALRGIEPAVTLGRTGDASLQKEIDAAFGEDLGKAGKLSLPVTLGILLLVFGALLAAGIPVLLAFTAVMATIGLVNLISHVSTVDQAVAEVVLLIGMAVGVDYSLFYIRREREERAAGRGPQAAIEAAAATSGRAILVSGATVIVAMAGMLVAGDKTFVSFAIGTMLVVAVAMVGSLTVLPAMLAACGDRIEKGRVPLLGRLRGRRPAGSPGVWSAIVGLVLRRPLISAVAAVVVLGAMAFPALELDTEQTGPSDFPKDLPAIQAYYDMQEAFPQQNLPAFVAYRAADVRSPESQAAIARFTDRIEAERESYAGATVTYSKDRRLARIDVPLVDSTSQPVAEREVRQLRDSIIPQTLGAVPGAHADVSGMAARSIDFDALMKQRAPIVFVFVLGLSFLLLTATFRSIVIPIKAILLNLLSVGAAYGALVLVFKHGWGAELLGFEPTGKITSWLPLFLFVILFGLSMDYHVFILSRVRELVDRGMSTEDAVREGIGRTAGVVTSAAAVMIAVFAIFGSLSMLPFKQMGVGLAVAVLVDATIIRAVLLPASMKLLGRWNWYLPSWLEWLPDVKGKPGPAAAQSPAPVVTAAPAAQVELAGP